MSRPPTRLDAIVDNLRGQILSGDYAPGDRLPTRIELQEHYAASSITVQRALDVLGEDGFVEARGRNGTFVATNPPHTSHYAVVFAQRLREGGWNEFWTALHAQAMGEMWQSGQRRLTSYLGIDGHTDSEDYQRLVRDIASRRIAGIFFASAPHNLLDTPLLTADVPRAAIGLPNDFAHVASVVLDEDAFIAKALDHLKARGRKRIALLMFAGHGETFLGKVRIALKARGMTTHDRWVHGCSAASSSTRWLRGWAQLLMDRGQSERPDGLFISDDNLVEHSTGGLIAAGVRVPQDMDVVAHCNFPYPTPSVISARRLGFDARQVLASAVDLLARARHPKHPHHVVVPPHFEDELPS